jgi:hypothetical protein
MATDFIKGVLQGGVGTNRYYDAQTSRRIASADLELRQQEARERQAKAAAEANQKEINDLYTNMRGEGYISISDKGIVELSKKFKDDLEAGNKVAAQYAASVAQYGKLDYVPENFNINRLDRGTDPSGKSIFVVGGKYADDKEAGTEGAVGVITAHGASDDATQARPFTTDDLFGQLRVAFRGKGGLLQSQKVYDRADFRLSVELAEVQRNILKSAPNKEVQRELSAVIGSAKTPAEEVEITKTIADDVGVDSSSLDSQEFEGAGEKEGYVPSEAEKNEDPARLKILKDDFRQKFGYEMPANLVEQAIKTGRYDNPKRMPGTDAFGKPIEEQLTDEDRKIQGALDHYRRTHGVEMPKEALEQYLETGRYDNPNYKRTPGKDNSAQIAKLEDELASIENRKTGSRRANVEAARKKRAEIDRLKKEQEPSTGPQWLGFEEAKFAMPEPFEPEAEQVVKDTIEPIVTKPEGGVATPEEIDKKVDAGVEVTENEQRAIAEDLQKQGVKTIQDIRNLDVFRQAMLYAMVTARAQPGAVREATRNNFISFITTGRTEAEVEGFKANTARMNALTSANDLQLKIANYKDKQQDDAGLIVDGVYERIYSNNFNRSTGELTGDWSAVKQLANQELPRLWARAIGAGGVPAAQKLYADATNSIMHVILQQLAERGESGGIVDSFISLFRSGVDGNISPDLSRIQISGDKIYYRKLREDGKAERAGEGVSYKELLKVSPEVAGLIKNIAEQNAQREAQQEGA